MLIQKSEIKKESFPSVDGDGKPVVLTAKDLTNLFCCADFTTNPSSVKLGKETTRIAHVLASKHHTEAIAEFVNRELLAFQRT